MAESFRFRNDSAISLYALDAPSPQEARAGKLTNVAVHVEPGAAHLLKARQLVHAALHPLLRRGARHRPVIRNELHRTGGVKGATRSTQNIQAVSADTILQLQGGRAGTRMPARQQVRRIPCRKGGKTRAHQLLRRGSGQRTGGGKLAQEPAAAGAVHLATRAGAAVVMIQFSHANQYRERDAPRKPRVKKAQRQEGTAQRNARSAGDTVLSRTGVLVFNR